MLCLVNLRCGLGWVIVCCFVFYRDVVGINVCLMFGIVFGCRELFCLLMCNCWCCMVVGLVLSFFVF